MKKLLYAVIIMTLFINCAPPTVKTTILQPAVSTDAARLKEIAVVSFEGKDGTAFSSEIEALLASINIADAQYFTVLDRKNLQAILKEMEISMTSLISPETAAQIGKVIGAKGIYTGMINTSDVTNSHYKEDRTRCAYKIKKKDKKGKEYEECSTWETVKVSCTKRTATFIFTPRLIEVETAKIVYSKSHTGTSSSRYCEDSDTPISSVKELLQKAKEQAKSSFKRDIAPHYVTFSIILMDSTEGITSHDASKKLEQGIEYAKANRLDRACEFWGDARILSPNAPAILYNLGICSEVTGDLNSALDLYKKADRAYGTPDEKISSAIHRVNNAIAKDKKLKEQMAR